MKIVHSDTSREFFPLRYSGFRFDTMSFSCLSISYQMFKKKSDVSLIFDDSKQSPFLMNIITEHFYSELRLCCCFNTFIY